MKESKKNLELMFNAIVEEILPANPDEVLKTKANRLKKMYQEDTDSNMGKLGKDKVTFFEGIIVGKINYLFGCDQYGLAPQHFDKEKSKRAETEWFDIGRIEIVGAGVNPEDVQVEKPGADFNHDTPKN